MTTPKLSMPELSVGQAGKELTHNQALAILDQLAQAVVVDKDLATPPGSPANGAMYIPAPGATGPWAGQTGKLAFWLTTVAAWTFITPVDGWSVWVIDEAERYSLVGGIWVLSTAELGLGTAAFANAQASITDTTAGRLVIQGGTSLATSDLVVIGYGTGAGGTVTQATSKGTAVTLNKPSGQIVMNGASLPANNAVAFALLSNSIAASDVVYVCIKGGQSSNVNYTVNIASVSAGQCAILLRNMTGAALSEAVILNFAVIKGAIA